MAKSKDPACLWYWGDWFSGTSTLTRHLKGCYMDLLHAQFNNGKLSLSEIKTVLGADFAAWQTLQKKFKEENGLFFNTRLQTEKEKRENFTKSRSNNLKSKPEKKPHMGTHKGNHMAPHMDNENEIDIWKLEFTFLKEDAVWWEQEVKMKSKLIPADIDHHLKQHWLALQKSNFKGELKQIRASFKKWINTVEKGGTNSVSKNEPKTEKLELLD